MLLYPLTYYEGEINGLFIFIKRTIFPSLINRILRVSDDLRNILYIFFTYLLSLNVEMRKAVP